MKPQWDSFVAELGALKVQWDALFPKLPEQIPISQPPQHISREELTKAIVDVVSVVTAINERDDVDPVMLAVHQPGVQSGIAALRQGLVNTQNNPVPQHVMQIVSGIWTIHNSIAWISPPGLDKWFLDAVNKESLAAQLAGLREALSTVYSSSTDAFSKLETVGRTSEEIKKIAEEIKGREREAGTAKTNAESSAAAAAASKAAVDTTLKSLTDGLAAYSELSKKINKLQLQVEATLEGASKVGLARSFTKRRKALFINQIVWVFAFILGICGMVIVPSVIYEKYISSLVSQDVTPLWKLVIRAFLDAPIVWFTWFAVRQYGHTTRLMEDYAFKEAAAMSFVGYRQEMGEDKEMLKMLQESAIKSFASNPVRVLGKTDPTTPTHELIEKAIDKGGIDRAVDLAKSLIGKG